MTRVRVTYVVVLEVRAQDRAAELADIGHHEAAGALAFIAYMRVYARTTHTYLVPSSVQLMNWADLGSLIILKWCHRENKHLVGPNKDRDGD